MVAVQLQAGQAGQAGEHVRVEGRQLVVVQTQGRQSGQPGEHARGEGPERAVMQFQGLQPAQPGEHARGDGGKGVGSQHHPCQVAQPGQVARPEGGDVAHVQFGAGEQPGRRDRLATTRAHVRDNLVAHRRGAATEVGRMDDDGERQTGDVRPDVAGRPGQGDDRGHGGRRAGQRARAEVEGQSGGKSGERGQRIGQDSVAAGGRRQRQHRNGVEAVILRRHHRPAEIRHDVHLDRHGERQAGGIGDRRVGIRIRDRPGQDDGRDVGRDAAQGRGQGGKAEGQSVGNGGDRGQRIDRGTVAACGYRQGQVWNGLVPEVQLRRHTGIAEIRHEVGPHGHVHGHPRRLEILIRGRPGQDDLHVGGRGAGQGARSGVVGQTGGNVRNGDQGVEQLAMAAGGCRQGQGRDGTVHDVRLRRHRRVKQHCIVVAHRDRDTVCRADAAVAAHGMGDDDGQVRVVPVLPGGDGDHLRAVPVRGGKTPGAGEGDPAAARRHRHRPGRGGIEHDGIGRRLAFRDGEGRGIDAHPGPARRDQSEAGIHANDCIMPVVGVLRLDTVGEP